MAWLMVGVAHHGDPLEVEFANLNSIYKANVIKQT